MPRPGLFARRPAREQPLPGLAARGRPEPDGAPGARRGRPPHRRL